jgi:acyl-coenzyme A thioesterase PaaI-like protein
MRVSEISLKWLMRFYPPLFFQRIWVKQFDKGFRGVEVRIRKSIWNRNYNNSIFGGTIFAAADAFYPILFYKILSQKGYKLRAWSKSLEIQYLKPGFTDLYYKISINEAEILEAEEILNTIGKYSKPHPIQIYDKNGVNVASVMNEVYMRNLNFIDTNNAHNN